jgi:hypothetical protein
MKRVDAEWLGGLDRNHPLIRPLQRGEDPAWKDEYLLVKLGAATYQEATRMLAELLGVPGYLEASVPARKRGKKGRPDTPTVLLEAAGVESSLVPPIARLLTYKLALRSIAETKSPGKIMNVEHRARQVLRQETLGGWRNPIQFTKRETLKKYAKSLKEDYTHSPRFNKRNEPLIQRMEAQWPRWKRFEPLLLELLPLYLEKYVTTTLPAPWDNLFGHCEFHYALLDYFKQEVHPKYDIVGLPDPITIFTLYIIKGKEIRSVHNFIRLPARGYILKLASEPDIEVRFEFRWGSPNEATGVPNMTKERG